VEGLRRAYKRTPNVRVPGRALCEPSGHINAGLAIAKTANGLIAELAPR
jgi:hypothetical protein